ncbi:unnamed protein product [Bursaphelenchus okinawaensis]|uniref:Uncharacterized protein n=1 Tax=Bursaphelenchus okinawaensis TaxID=465554 RepID=A0A811K4R8_9BILA|nr:unnamed protein product [Bursaphelenchus okinawaensis]CAG9090677.1 unnamed protein product [Bursaphelenchus okinawaensis]
MGIAKYIAGDSDRRIDACGIRRQKYNVFKNKLRDAFDEHGHDNMRNLIIDDDLQNQVKNTMIKLQSVLFILNSMNLQGELSGLVGKTSELYDEIGRATKGSDEFTVSNIKFPVYDDTAFDLIFGSANKDEEVSISNVQELKHAFSQKMNQFMEEANKLLEEYRTVMDDLKTVRLLNNQTEILDKIVESSNHTQQNVLQEIKRQSKIDEQRRKYVVLCAFICAAAGIFLIWLLKRN